MGKHQKGKHTNKKPNLKILLLILIVVIAIVAFKIFSSKDKKLFTLNKKADNPESGSSIEIVDDIEMPEKIGDYDVLGLISIEKLDIEEYILNETTDESLELAVSKFELPEYKGPDINEVGNFVIAGHNYENVFAHVVSLQPGDTFYVIDREHSRKITYEVYEVYDTYPDDIECLNQETNGKREVTLITCNTGLVTRCIIKAKEK